MEAKQNGSNANNFMVSYFALQAVTLLVAADGLLFENYFTFGVGVIAQMALIIHIVAKYSGTKNPQQN